MQWGQGWLTRMEANCVADARKVKATTKAALAWVASRFSFEVVSQTDLWSVLWGVRLDVGKYSLYLGMAKDRG